MKPQTICLCMIVKNEARVIERCLASVRPLIDTWVISDTGSTDGTQDLIREALDGIPGELRQDPWVDFGRNRTRNIQHARAGPTSCSPSTPTTYCARTRRFPG
nr:glycosyltransferase [Streptomyces sp. LBUM 1477]